MKEQGGGDEVPAPVGEQRVLGPVTSWLLAFFGSEQVGIGRSFTLELDDNNNDQVTNKRRYDHLGILHRVFLIAENPSSCLFGKLWSLGVAVITLISVVVYILDSLPELSYTPSTCESPACNNDPVLCPGTMICEPASFAVLLDIENVCLYIFIADYFTRFLLCGTVPSHMANVAPRPDVASEERILDSEIMTSHHAAQAAASASAAAASASASAAAAAATVQQSEKFVPSLHETQDSIFRDKLDTYRDKWHAMKEKILYWRELEENCLQGGWSTVLPRLYLWCFRPVTELTYHPAQDPIYPVHYQIYLYTTKLMTMIDFVAILPFFIALSATKGTSFSVVRVLRLARVLRVLKLGKGSKGMVILFETVRDSMPALSILAFFSLIGVVLLGAIQFFCEGGNYQQGPGGTWDYYRIDKTSYGTEMTTFNSIPMSMYWVVITSTTVGFGDLYPTSYYGRLVAIVAAYGGMFVLALPISVIGNNFERIYDVAQGHLSHGVVYGIFELMADHNDVNQIIKDVQFQKMSNEDKSMELINVALKKLSAVFILAKNLLSKSSSSNFLRLMKELHVQTYLDAKIYLEEKRLEKLGYPVERTISDDAFFNEGDAYVAADPYRASRELLVRLRKVVPRASRENDEDEDAMGGGGRTGGGGGTGRKMKRAPTLMPLPEPGSAAFDQTQQRQRTLQQELHKLQAQLEIAQHALEACVKQAAMNRSQSEVHAARLRERNLRAFRQAEEVKQRHDKEVVKMYAAHVASSRLGSFVGVAAAQLMTDSCQRSSGGLMGCQGGGVKGGLGLGLEGGAGLEGERDESRLAVSASPPASPTSSPRSASLSSSSPASGRATAARSRSPVLLRGSSKLSRSATTSWSPDASPTVLGGIPVGSPQEKGSSTSDSTHSDT